MGDYGYFGKGITGYTHYTQATSSKSNASTPLYREDPILQQMKLSGNYGSDEEATSAYIRMNAEANRLFYESQRKSGYYGVKRGSGSGVGWMIAAIVIYAILCAIGRGS